MKKHAFLYAFLLVFTMGQATQVAVKKKQPPRTLEQLTTDSLKKVAQTQKEKTKVAPSVTQNSDESIPVVAPYNSEPYHAHNLDKLPKFDTKTTIPCAFVGSFNGHFSLYARLIRDGIAARFAEVNKSGGIKGKKLFLLCLDDKGIPALTRRIIETLQRRHNITLFIGNMGTRGLVNSTPIVRAKKVGIFFPWGGSSTMRTNKELSYIINGQGEMEPQLRALAAYCTEGLRLKKIAIFHSDGTFNTITKNLLVKILHEEGIKPVCIASYNRFTMNIHKPADRIMEFDPKVVICLGSSMPVAKLMGRFFELGYYGTKFMGIDSTMFVSDIMQARGAAYVYSSLVPDPLVSIEPIARDYRAITKELFDERNNDILSFNSYIHAKIVTNAMEKAEDAADHHQVVAEIKKFKNINMGGFMVNYNPETNSAYPHIISLIKKD